MTNGGNGARGERGAWGEPGPPNQCWERGVVGGREGPEAAVTGGGNWGMEGPGSPGGSRALKTTVGREGEREGLRVPKAGAWWGTVRGTPRWRRAAGEMGLTCGRFLGGRFWEATGRLSLWERGAGSLSALGEGYWEVYAPFQGDPGKSASPHRGRDERLFTRTVGVPLEGGLSRGPECPLTPPRPPSPQFTPWTGSWCSGCSWFALVHTCGRCPDCAPGSCLSAGASGESATRVRGTGDTGVWGRGAENTGVQDEDGGITGVRSGQGHWVWDGDDTEVWDGGFGDGDRGIGNGNIGVWDGNMGSGMGSWAFRMDLAWGHEASPHPVPPAAAVIGTRLHVAVSVSCLLMAFYVLVGK